MEIEKDECFVSSNYIEREKAEELILSIKDKFPEYDWNILPEQKKEDIKLEPLIEPDINHEPIINTEIFNKTGETYEDEDKNKYYFEEYEKLKLFLEKEEMKLFLNEIDYWYGDFEFAIIADKKLNKKNCPEIKQYFTEKGFYVCSVEKRRSAACYGLKYGCKDIFVIRIGIEDSEYFKKNPEEEETVLPSFDVFRKPKKAINKIVPIIMFSMIIFWIVILGIFDVKKETKNTKEDYISFSNEEMPMERPERLTPDLTFKNNKYDMFNLIIETTEDIKEYKNARFKIIGKNLIVMEYNGDSYFQYSDFCIFPKKNIKSISGSKIDIVDENEEYLIDKDEED